MPNSPRLMWPFPENKQNPYYDTFESMVMAMDATGYASREDRSIFLANGGDFSWTLSTNTLAWSATLNVISPIAGFHLDLAAGSVTIQEGQYFYLTLTRAPVGNGTLTAKVKSQVPNTDDDYAVAIRINNDIFFRTGIALTNGESAPIFAASTSPSTVPNPLDFGATIGNFTFDGTTTIQGIAPSGSVYTLTRDIFGANLTINSGVTIHTANWGIFVSSTLTNNGIISNNGSDGLTGTLATDPAAGRYSAVKTCGTAAGVSSTTAPLGYFTAAIAATCTSGIGLTGGSGTAGSGNGGAGGSGGTGSAAAGSDGGAVVLSTLVADRTGLLCGTVQAAAVSPLYTFGASGGCGANGTTNNGYGGSGGGEVYVAAPVITGTGSMRARGGAGGAALTGHPSGGGGGGGGGFVVLVYGTMSGQTIDANGGSGGLGADGGGTGGNGGSGVVVKFNLSGDGT